MVLWTALNLLLPVTFTIANITIQSRQCAAIWLTDFPDAHDAIKYEKRVCTEAFTHDRDRHQAICLRDVEKDYFGPPIPEVDRAWEELLHDIY